MAYSKTRNDNYTLNLFRGGRMVQIGEHYFNGTLGGAEKRAADLLVSEGVDRVSVESSSGTIMAVAKHGRIK